MILAIRAGLAAPADVEVGRSIEADALYDARLSATIAESHRAGLRRWAHGDTGVGAGGTWAWLPASGPLRTRSNQGAWLRRRRRAWEVGILIASSSPEGRTCDARAGQFKAIHLGTVADSHRCSPGPVACQPCGALPAAETHTASNTRATSRFEDLDCTSERAWRLSASRKAASRNRFATAAANESAVSARK